MKVSIIVPVYNEKETITEILFRIREVPLNKEIIVVDGDSTDGTKHLLREEEKRGDLKVLYEPCRRGKGAAVREGLSHATGEVVLIQDADLEVQPSEYPRLLQPILEGRTQVVFGSRFLSMTNRFPFSTFMANRTLTFLTNFFYGSHLTDVLTCHKVFRRDVVGQLTLECRRFDFDQELAVKLLKKKTKILEVPIRYTPRARREGKKILWKDGLFCLWVLLKYRFANGRER